ncbi:hypothetical protein FGRMN_3969 [Fusarium graminum]|nr:hypothetical protein FGRMN_3969 [Fusarium graminum]
MAVLDRVPHVTARVRVAGELATEYKPPDDQDVVINPDHQGSEIPSTHCYIESKSGARFAIEVTVAPNFKFPWDHDIMAIFVHIDGQSTSGKCIFKSYMFDQPHTSIISTTSFLIEAESGVPMSRKLVFAPIMKDCDSSTSGRVNGDIERAKKMGTIRLVLQTGRYTRTTTCNHNLKLKNQQLSMVEKALKGKELSHGTSLSELSGEPLPKNFCEIANKYELGEFVFRYRSYQALQHEMIIPRTPSPEPSLGTGPVEEALSLLSEREIRRLALERLQENMVKDESSRVKREAESPPTPRQWKMVKLDDGETAIDLTDD